MFHRVDIDVIDEYSSLSTGKTRNQDEAETQLAAQRGQARCAAGFLYDLDWSPEHVLDAGANIGLASRVAAALWPAALIVALEPDPANFALLQQNTAAYPNIHLEQVPNSVDNVLVWYKRWDAAWCPLF